MPEETRLSIHQASPSSGSLDQGEGATNNKWRLFLNPSTLLLVLGALFGTIFIALVPPGYNPDEVTHFTRAAQLAEGGVVAHGTAPGIGTEISDGVGGEVPTGVQDFFLATKAIGSGLPSWQAKSLAIDWAAARDIPTRTPLETVAIGGSSSYSPIAYIPSTLGFLIGKLLALPMIATFYLSRLLSLFTGILLAWSAIKLAPRGKWIFLSISLLPTTLIQLGAISSDTMSFGLSFLAIALTLRVAFQDSPVRWKQWTALATTFLALSLSKSLCITLLPILIAIPLCNRYTRTVVNFIKLVGGAVVAVLGTFIWQQITAQGASDPTSPNRVQIQNQFIIDNPITFIKTLIYTFFGGVGIPHEWISSFFGSAVSMSVALPTIFLISLSGILMLSPLIHERNESDWIGTRKTRLTLSLGLISVFIIFCIMAAIGIYGLWSLPRATVADGLQGRYFIPIAPVLLMAFVPLTARTSALQLRFRITTASILVLSCAAMAWQIWVYAWRGGIAAQWPS